MLRRLRCPHTGCSKSCRGPAALTKHVRHKHSQANRISRTPSPHLSPPPHLTANASSPGRSSNGQPEGLLPEPHLPPLNEPAAPKLPSRTHHPHLRGDICDAEGHWIPPDSEPPPPDATDNPWAPFEDKAQFELADLLYRKVEMSATNQDDLFGILQEMNEVHGHPAPFVNRKDMYNKIDAIPLGDVPWKRIYARFPGVVTDDDAEWKKDVMTVFFGQKYEI
ncbi:hypothetical protein ONZ45_g13551 [Pleurotus djamor]|nr:hypothetical protein ONZ45_g13551 [Pleurotus djamor]